MGFFIFPGKQLLHKAGSPVLPIFQAADPRWAQKGWGPDPPLRYPEAHSIPYELPAKLRRRRRSCFCLLQVFLLLLASLFWPAFQEMICFARFLVEAYARRSWRFCFDATYGSWCFSSGFSCCARIWFQKLAFLRGFASKKNAMSASEFFSLLSWATVQLVKPKDLRCWVRTEIQPRAELGSRLWGSI